MRSLAVPALVVLAAGCAASPSPSPDAAILPEAAVPALLRQCSRASPRAGEGTWTPAWSDIAALEAALPAALRADSLGAPLAARGAPEGWRRQYVGLIRDGRRIIYGNFGLDRGAGDPAWRTRPAVVCDGGSSFFGVEYDVAARRVVGLAFNGPY